MAERATYIPEPSAVETAEVAFRRIARRKLVERGVPEDQIEHRITDLLQTGAKLDIDVDAILGRERR